MNQKLPILQSVHGPVISQKDNKALAVRQVGFEQTQVFKQYWDMIRAKNLDEFQSIISRVDMPFFNTIYADKDGHIMYLFGGRTPKRSQGDWAMWQGVVPGNSSDYLWTATHTYEELPKVIDPQSGFVQNANDPPWTSTFPQALDADEFPAYIAPREMGFRPQRSARMAFEDDRISYEELYKYKHSARLETADRLLDDLLPAVEEHGDIAAKKAGEILQNWDRQALADSKGAVLFIEWMKAVGEKVYAKPWDAANPRATPDGIADPKAAVAALSKVALKVGEKYGTMDVPYGEVYRLKRGEKEYPANGAAGELGVFRTLWTFPREDGTFQAFHGDSYVGLVEFGEEVKAKVLISYGNSSQPESPHNGDQLELFSKQQMRDAWTTRKAVEQHLEKTDVLE